MRGTGSPRRPPASPSTARTRSGSARWASRSAASPPGSPRTANCCSRRRTSSAGYWKNPDATKEALEDEGWFHTGDIGEIDDDGYVRITGRKKELIVTAGGKNVAPAVLEDRVRAHWLVSQCLVVGDQKPFIAALITIDPEAFPTWLEQERPAGRTPGRGPGRRRRPARRDADRDRRREQGSQQGRVDPQVRDPGRGLDRDRRPAHSVAQAQAQRGPQGGRGEIDALYA